MEERPIRGGNGADSRHVNCRRESAGFSRAVEAAPNRECWVLSSSLRIWASGETAPVRFDRMFVKRLGSYGFSEMKLGLMRTPREQCAPNHSLKQQSKDSRERISLWNVLKQNIPALRRNRVHIPRVVTAIDFRISKNLRPSRSPRPHQFRDTRKLLEFLFR